MTQPNRLFRDAPLEGMASPELLDQQTAIVRPGSWILLTGLLCAALAAGFWAWTGNISDGVKANGIIFPSTGVQAVFTQTSGFVENALVREGDFVEQGQIMLVIPNEELLQTIMARQEELEMPEWQSLADEYERTSIIRSPVSGTVQSIAAANSMTVPGQRAAHIIPEDRLTNSKEVVAFVPFSISKKIRPGMEAQVSPAFAPREEYGYMRGYVSSVASIPATSEMLQKTFGDNSYAKSLSVEENSAEVRIMLHMDASSKNSFQWSNKKGEELMVETGTVCQVQIITDTKRPIDLLLQFRE